MLMTGYAEQRERAEELNGIILDVVQKPFTLAEIRSRVDAALSCPVKTAA
jgi:DNA-binding response OmpR family regulator